MSELRRLLKQAVGATDPARLVGCVIAANAALEAYNHEIEVETARKVLAAVLRCTLCLECVDGQPILEDGKWVHRWQSAAGKECARICCGSVYRNAVLALYPELKDDLDEDFDYPAALAEAVHDDVALPVEPGKERV